MTWWIIFLEYCKKKNKQIPKQKNKKKQKKNEKKQNKAKKNKTKQNKTKKKQKKNQKKFYICKSSPRVPWREFLFLECLTRKTSFFHSNFGLWKTDQIVMP